MKKYNYTLDTRGFRIKCKHSCAHSKQKLHVFDWLSDKRNKAEANELVEVQFKNTRKEYFSNTHALPLDKGDVVVVESSYGYDVGEISLIGELVERQMKKNHINLAKYSIRKIYRKATLADLDKLAEAKAKENNTMLRSRQIAKDLNLNMKIGDVDFQGDGNRAIFYYIANEWVDFRELIKVLADAFKIRIEMKQIGARQEAGLIGGIGSCGRELCCSSWMTNFKTVSTHAARYQHLPVNPQKLTGQCAKLKCCLNYELDTYIEAQKDMPRTNIPLEFEDTSYFHFKTNLLNKTISYSTEKGMDTNLITLTAQQVKETLAKNKEGIKPTLPKEVRNQLKENDKALDFDNVVGQDDLTRFDKKKTHKRNKPKFKKEDNNKRSRQAFQKKKSSNPHARPKDKEEKEKQGKDKKQHGRPQATNNNRSKVIKKKHPSSQSPNEDSKSK